MVTCISISLPQPLSGRGCGLGESRLGLHAEGWTPHTMWWADSLGGRRGQEGSPGLAGSADESCSKTSPRGRPLGFLTLTMWPQGPSLLRRNALVSKLLWPVFLKMAFEYQKPSNRAENTAMHTQGPWWLWGGFLVLHQEGKKGADCFERRGHEGYFSS